MLACAKFFATCSVVLFFPACFFSTLWIALDNMYSIDIDQTKSGRRIHVYANYSWLLCILFLITAGFFWSLNLF